MSKIVIVDKIHSNGIKLLEKNHKFQHEVIENKLDKSMIVKLYPPRFTILD